MIISKKPSVPTAPHYQVHEFIPTPTKLGIATPTVVLRIFNSSEELEGWLSARLRLIATNSYTVQYVVPLPLSIPVVPFEMPPRPKDTKIMKEPNKALEAFKLIVDSIAKPEVINERHYHGTQTYEEYIPVATYETLMKYLYHGTPTGGFTQAVIQDSLSEALARADTSNAAALRAISMFVSNVFPRAARDYHGWIKGHADLKEYLSA